MKLKIVSPLPLSSASAKLTELRNPILDLINKQLKSKYVIHRFVIETPLSGNIKLTISVKPESNSKG